MYYSFKHRHGLIVFSVSSIYVYEHILTYLTLYHVKHNDFDIQFASKIAVVDKDIYVVGLFY